MTTDKKAMNGNAGKTSVAAKASNRRRRSEQQSEVAMRNGEKKAASADAPNSRSSAGAKLIRVGEGVGRHERSYAPVKPSERRRKRKQWREAALESATVLPTNRTSVPTAGTACSKCGRFPERIAGSLAGAKLLRTGEVEKGDGSIHPRKSCGKGGCPRRARQKGREQSGKILCSRTLLAAEEQLQLRCAHDISGQRDEVAIPSLEHPHARSDRMAESRSLPQHLTSLERHQCGGVSAFFKTPSEDRSQYNGDVLKRSHTHSARSLDAAVRMLRDPFIGCRFPLAGCEYACTGRKKKGRRGRTIEDERSRDEGRNQRFVQMNNDTFATSRLKSPSKDAARRPHRGDARTRLQPRGTADTTPHHPESTTDSTMDAMTTVARTRWKKLRPQAVAAQKAM
ncbi:hypothetical protein Aduo_015285 [Ancylostoma duodenale]